MIIFKKLWVVKTLLNEIISFLNLLNLLMMKLSYEINLVNIPLLVFPSSTRSYLKCDFWQNNKNQG